MTEPSISVIIPVYNTERYLADALQSVLAQTYPVQEIIVVDDGSTDGSGVIARQFPQVTLMVQENQGTAAACNLGIQAARSPFLAFLDADDLWLPTKLAQQMQAFKAHPQVDIVFAHVQQFISPDLDPASQAKLSCPAEPMPCPTPLTMLARRSVFQSVGGFSSTFKHAGFLDWYNRTQFLGMVALTLPDVLARRRLHTANVGVQSRQAVHQEYLRIAKAAIDRRRGHSSHVSAS